MEPQTVYYTNNPANNQVSSAQIYKSGGAFIEAANQGTPQAIYFTPGAQQTKPQVQYQPAQQTTSSVYYSPQVQPRQQQPMQQTIYSPQVQPQLQQPQQTIYSPQVQPQVYTIGASTQQQYQQSRNQFQPQSQPQQILFSPNQQGQSRVVYASSAQQQQQAYQPQTQYQPQPQQQPQPASPTRIIQYSPQSPGVQAVSYASQQQQPTTAMIYQAAGQPQVIRLAQPPAQSQIQPQYAPSAAAQPIDRSGYPGSANQVQVQYQSMAKPQGVTMAPAPVQSQQPQPYYQQQTQQQPVFEPIQPVQVQRPQQYQPPQQTLSPLQQAAAAIQQGKPQTPQARPQQPQYQKQQTPTSPGGEAPKLRQIQPRRSMDRGDIDSPPQFVQQPVPQVTVNEGDGITLKAIVRPAGDSTLDVQWLKNGVVVSASSRHNAVLDRGYAEFQFLYTNMTDAGEYVCVAKTANGTAQSTPCVVTIIPEEGVVTDSQLPEESMIMNLAAMESQMAMNGTPRREDENKFTTPPQFVRPLLPQIGLKENEGAKFETFVQPANDPSLTVEWFKDGEPLKTGCRFTETMDRGYVILDIHYTYPEDSGQYHCVAKNNAGSTPSNVVELSCKGGTGIVTDSVLSAESVHYLQSLDAINAESGFETRYADNEHQAPAPPSFELEPKNTTAIEGSPVKLLVKAGGFPHPRVQWLINGDVLPTSGGGGAWRIYNDGGISYLEFNRCGPAGDYVVIAVAKNAHGEASAECNLVIDPQPDYRPDLKHVAPENPFRRMASLRRVERTDELKSAFEKTKPKVLELRKLERRNSQTDGLNDTEQMYAQVQANLRSSRRSVQGDPIRPPPAQAPQQYQTPPIPKPQPPPPQSIQPQNTQSQQLPPHPQVAQQTPSQQKPMQQQQFYSQPLNASPQVQTRPPQQIPAQPQAQMQPQNQPITQRTPPAPQATYQAPPPPPPAPPGTPSQVPSQPQFGDGAAVNGQPNQEYTVTETSAEFQLEL